MNEEFKRLYAHWSKLEGGFQHAIDNVLADIRQEAYYPEELVEVLTIAKGLDARVQAYDDALRHIFSRSCIKASEDETLYETLDFIRNRAREVLVVYDAPTPAPPAEVTYGKHDDPTWEQD